MQSVNQYRKGSDSVRRVWKTPELDYYNLYADMLQQPHLLIAGATGTSKNKLVIDLIGQALQNTKYQKICAAMLEVNKNIND